MWGLPHAAVPVGWAGQACLPAFTTAVLPACALGAPRKLPRTTCLLPAGCWGAQIHTYFADVPLSAIKFVRSSNSSNQPSPMLRTYKDGKPQRQGEQNSQVGRGAVEWP
jgi:hypothetical protein